MSTGLIELRDEQLDEALEQVLLPGLVELIGRREPGHCLRIADVGSSLAARLCRRLRTASATPHCYVLATTGADVPRDVAASSSKLVELRNPDATGRQRPVLVAFIPPGAKASAEDSFGVATFEDVTLTDAYTRLEQRLAQETPAALHAMIFGELFAALDEETWPYADTLAKARYLLTCKHNDFDRQAAGAAVFELGLVPDFDLFREAGQVAARARRNLDAMRILTLSPASERQRVLALGLADTALQRRLSEFAAQVGLDDPRGWTRRIVIDAANWRLGFHEWALAQPTTAVDVRIEVLDLDLPVAQPSSALHENSPLERLIGQQYLLPGPGGRDKFTVRFRVDPEPRRVPGLARFAVQIFAEDGGATGLVTTVSAGQGGKSEFKAVFAKLSKASWEEGWHFVRVTPLDSDGQAITASGRTSANAAESDRFYVDTADDDADDLPERPADNAAGVMQALREAQFAVLADGGDPNTVRLRGLTPRPASRSRPGIVRASFTGNHLADILLPGPLQQIETSLLSEPQILAQWRLPVGPDGVGTPRRATPAWPSNPDRHELAEFHTARAAVFDAIRTSTGHLVELADLTELREQIRAYADSYKALLSRQLRRSQTAQGAEQAAALHALGDLLRIDTVGVDLRDYHAGQREALLIAPTHPLRMLWLLTWMQLAGVWLRWSGETSTEEILATRTTLFDALSPRGFPYATPQHDGRLLISADDLNPYWGVALPSDTTEPQELLTRLRDALKLTAATPTTAGLSQRLAERIDHYLRQHPYIDCLVVNVLGAVRTDLLTDALRALARRTQHPHLRFDVRLIVEDPESPGIADNLAALAAATDPEPATGGDRRHEEALDPLRPRLAIAVQSIDEFRDHPEKWSAHLSILIDAFATEQLDAAPFSADPQGNTSTRRGIAPVHGLVQQTLTRYREDAETISWHRQPRFGASYPLPGAEDLSDLLAELPSVLSAAACAVTTMDPQTTRVPTATLNLEAIDQVLLYQAHNVSDWVITIDRTLGLEYFDQGGRADRADYVIDHDTDQLAAGGRRMVVSSRSTDELRSLLAPVVDQHGLRLDPRHTATLFDQMRFLSGRLAFKLASTARTQRTEVLGLALARLYLDYQDALREQILVPLDAHQELYREPRARRSSILDNQRTDLALFDLNARARRITCRLIEVKCYTTLGDISDYQRLKERIAGQLEASADIIGQHFDPRRFEADRPDRTVKNLQLATLLGHYLDRAVRHGIMDSTAADEAAWLLEHLDAGYRLEFTRTGLVFDLARPGTETETDDGIEYHRIGRDLIQDLVDAVPTDQAPRRPAAQQADDETPTPSLASLDLTVPRLREAAFHTPQRAHETPHAEPDIIDPDHEDEPENQTPYETRPATTDLDNRDTGTARTAHDDAAALGPERPATSSPAGTDRTNDDLMRQPDVFLGTTAPTAQFGLIGRAAGRTIALDLNETHTISLFGVQGGGKSYTLGNIIEMATLPIPGINHLTSPLATIVFHYSSTQDYAPEFTSMSNPNDNQAQLATLLADYRAHPHAHHDIVLLAPADHVDQRRTEYPDLTVRPLAFSSAELQAAHWRFLMGAVGNQSTYIRQLTRIMRANRGNLTLPAIRTGIDASNLSDTLKQLAHQRLDLAADYIDDSAHLRDLVRPGRLIIVDLRDEFIEKDEALGLFVVLMQLFAEARIDGRHFNKLVVFDEAHKYIDSPDLVAGLVETVREMRHKGMSVLVASQDPPSVPISLIELSNHIVMHKFTSPAWLKHLQRANAALTGLTAEKMANLSTGEAFVWSSKATDATFTRAAAKMTWRPRVTRHGGETRTATQAAPETAPGETHT
jgi:hypothetical protein